MEEITEGFVAHSAEEITPFPDEDAYLTTVDKDIDVSQLADEITKASGVNVVVVVMHNPLGSGGELYVRPPVDAELVEAAVQAHVPDPDYGLSEEVKERQALMKKIDGGIPLTSDEVMRALKLSLARF